MHTKRFSLIGVLVALLVVAPTASAKKSDAARLRALEVQVSRMSTQVATLSATVVQDRAAAKATSIRFGALLACLSTARVGLSDDSLTLVPGGPDTLLFMNQGCLFPPMPISSSGVSMLPRQITFNY